MIQTDAAGRPLVSVVIAVYNGEKYLAEQIESVLAQSHRNLEVLIADDGSGDSSVRIAQGYAGRDARVRVIQNPRNLGLVMNFLNGVAQSAGDFVCFCDQDDVWSLEKITELAGLLEARPEKSLAYSDLEVCDAAVRMTQDSFLRANRIHPANGAVGEKAMLKNGAPGCSMMFRKSVVDLVRRLLADEAFVRINRAEKLDEIPVMHDHLVWILASGLGDIAYCPRPLVRYRQHATNSIGAFYEARRGNEVFIRGLAARLEALKSVEADLTRIDWGAVRRFLARYRSSARAPMPGFLGYFLWIRNATAKDQLLGVLDCLAPSLYRKLKGSR